MPQARWAPQDPQVSKEREVPLDVLGRQVSNGRGAGWAHVPLCPPPPATRSELAFQGESQCWALGTVCLQGEGGESGRDCLYPGKAGCQVMGHQCTEVIQEEVAGIEGHLHVGGCMAGGYESMYGGCGGGGTKEIKNTCSALTHFYFSDPRACWSHRSTGAFRCQGPPRTKGRQRYSWRQRRKG